MTGDIVALDVEAGWNDTYSQAWCAAVKAAGFTTWLYGLDSEVNAHGAPFDGVWAARYVYPTVPTPTSRESVQYWNSHTEFGTSVDRSVCDDHWIGELPMTDAEKQDLASALAQLAYASVYNRDPSGDAGGVDFWYNQMVANGYGNPIKTIVESDEAKGDYAKWAGLTQPTPVDVTALTARVAALEAKLAAVKGDL